MEPVSAAAVNEIFNEVLEELEENDLSAEPDEEIEPVEEDRGSPKRRVVFPLPPFQSRSIRLPKEPADEPFPKRPREKGFEAPETEETERVALLLSKPRGFVLRPIPLPEAPELEAEFSKYPIGKLARQLPRA
jgi:hypothetical protein